ncbi:MAG: hypothetical protein F6K41_34885 [Symploca sp. SIO3E6]|nr:hypothetical protein [Caldora sp. SIO3E6]
MIYNDLALIIPCLAAVYVLMIYLLLRLAEHTTKNSRYLTSSFTDAYVPYLSKDAKDTEQKIEELEPSSPQKIQQVTIVR